VEASGRGAIRAETLPGVEPGAVRVEALYSAVSRGTESLVWRGAVPESEYERMRCPHQAGDFPFPVKYGYSSVGRVVEGPDQLCGRSVFCLYPHQSSYVVASDAVVLLPEGVPEARAVLGANLETALNALWDACPLIGDRVSVVGAGVVGAMVAYLARGIAAAEVELVDVRSERARLASAIDVDFAAPGTARRGRDIVFDASGTRDGLAVALDLVAEEGVVTELSWYGDQDVAVPLGGRFHSGRLTLRASQVGRLSPHARARFTPRERLRLALTFCKDPRLDALIDGEIGFEDLPFAMPEITAASSGALCRRVRYP